MTKPSEVQSDCENKALSSCASERGMIEDLVM